MWFIQFWWHRYLQQSYIGSFWSANIFHDTCTSGTDFSLKSMMWRVLLILQIQLNLYCSNLWCAMHSKYELCDVHLNRMMVLHVSLKPSVMQLCPPAWLCKWNVTLLQSHPAPLQSNTLTILLSCMLAIIWVCLQKKKFL